MLKDPIDFDYAISKVKEEMDLDIKLQDDILDSSNMNESFLSMEKNLNKLYEDTRYIQDAIDYCKMFLTLKIDEYSKDIYTVVKSIEDIADINKNMSYIEFPVKFIENKVHIPDRSKTHTIYSTEVKDNSLVLGTKLDKVWEIKDIDRKCDFKPYQQNLEELKDGSYRAIYVEENTGMNGLVETLVITLNGAREVNFLDIVPVNCTIKNVRYVYFNGIEEYVGDLETGIRPDSRIVTHIKIDVVCDKYTQTTYTLDKTKMTENLWNGIKEYEGKLRANIESKLDAEGIISRTTIKSNGEKDTKVFAKKPSSTIRMNMYTYSFGIDYLRVKRIVQYEDGYFISEPIEVGKLNEKEYLQLVVDQTEEDAFGSEFYIVDGDREIPMNPIGEEHIENERIFPHTDLVFPMDEGELGEKDEYIIKKDGVTSEMSLDDALSKYRGRYSIDYFPLTHYNYTPMTTSIRVKAVMRTYGKWREFIPKINSIRVRKYGGSNLWINKY